MSETLPLGPWPGSACKPFGAFPSLESGTVSVTRQLAGAWSGPRPVGVQPIVAFALSCAIQLTGCCHRALSCKILELEDVAGVFGHDFEG